MQINSGFTIIGSEPQLSLSSYETLTGVASVLEALCYVMVRAPPLPEREEEGKKSKP